MNTISSLPSAKNRTSIRALVARWSLLLLGTLSCCGCAAFTNPVANGIPVRLVPDELLAQPKEALEYIPWGLLQRTPPEEPIIQPEDVLGVYVVGVLGNESQLPPVQLPDAANVPPALGFPIPVREDGTIPLPMVDDPVVAGMTVAEAEEKLINAFTVDKEVLQPDQTIILTMIRPKHVSVLVIRQDSQGSRGGQFRSGRNSLLATSFSSANALRQGSGFELDMPATQADVLRALSLTGGLPGVDAKDEILIYRNARQSGVNADTFDASRHSEPERISIKVKKGGRADIDEADISLNEGDILVVESRDTEMYYTGGLMLNQEIPLPYDYDLTVTEAVSRTGGPLMNGGFGGANFNGQIVGRGMGNPSPSLLTVLRKAPNNQQVAIRVDLNEALRDPRENIIVQSGDMLILQETPGEAFARYMTAVFRFSAAREIGNTGAVSVSVP